MVPWYLTYLQLATAAPLTASASRRRALEIAEGSKSRLLSELVGRGELAVPPVLAQQAIGEGELLAELTNWIRQQLASYGHLATSEEKVSDAARWQIRQTRWQEVEHLWQEHG